MHSIRPDKIKETMAPHVKQLHSIRKSKVPNIKDDTVLTSRALGERIVSFGESNQMNPKCCKI